MDPHGAGLMEVRESKDPIYITARKQELFFTLSIKPAIFVIRERQ